MPELLAASALLRLQHPAVDRLVVAISGGVDSTALLHAVSQTVVQAVVNVQVQGLHIHHGLVANADLLSEAAQRRVEDVGVVRGARVVLGRDLDADDGRPTPSPCNAKKTCVSSD